MAAIAAPSNVEARVPQMVCGPAPENYEITEELSYWLQCADQRIPQGARNDYKEKVRNFAREAYGNIAKLAYSDMPPGELKQHLCKAASDLREFSRDLFDKTCKYEQCKAKVSERFAAMHEKIKASCDGLNFCPITCEDPPPNFKVFVQQWSSADPKKLPQPDPKQFIQQWSADNEKNRPAPLIDSWSEAADLVCHQNSVTDWLCAGAKHLFGKGAEMRYQFPQEPALKSCLDNNPKFVPDALHESAAEVYGGQQLTQAQLDKKLIDVAGGTTRFYKGVHFHVLQAELQGCATKEEN